MDVALMLPWLLIDKLPGPLETICPPVMLETPGPPIYSGQALKLELPMP